MNVIDTDLLLGVATSPLGANGALQPPEIIAPACFPTARITPLPQVNALHSLAAPALRASQYCPSSEVATRFVPSFAIATKKP
ncbi:unannotated protein [freshwater metagenome]|uniref:Unannotated protein n=1 Tax=freshwater metagenome TaxID=449393 RepID=A0A6J7KSV8_9ZZZZ